MRRAQRMHLNFYMSDCPGMTGTCQIKPTSEQLWLNKQNLPSYTGAQKQCGPSTPHLMPPQRLVETETSFVFVPIVCILVQQVTMSTTKCDLLNIAYPLSSVQVNVTLMVGHQIFVTVITATHRWCKNCYWGDVVFPCV